MYGVAQGSGRTGSDAGIPADTRIDEARKSCSSNADGVFGRDRERLFMATVRKSQPYAAGRRRRCDARHINIGGGRLLPGSTADGAGAARAVSRPGAWVGYVGRLSRDGASRGRRRGIRLGGQGQRVRCGIVAAAPLVFLATPARTRVIRTELLLRTHVGSLASTSSVAKFNWRRRQSAHPANQSRPAKAVEHAEPLHSSP